MKNKKNIKNGLIGLLVLLALIFGASVLKSKNNTIVSPVPVVSKSTTLPSSFTMSVIGDFNDPSITSPYEGYPGNSAFLISSGGEELQGEVQYTYSAPGTDGNLILCEIKNKKWVTNTDTYKECTALAKLATTRTELIKQIEGGILKPTQSDLCTKNNLCYEFKIISNNNSQSKDNSPFCESMGCLQTKAGEITSNTLNTRTDFGISFIAPGSDWKGQGDIGGGEIGFKQTSTGDTITMQYISGNSITDTDAKFGPVTYYFDARTQQWMRSSPDESGNQPGLIVTIASPIAYTGSGLAIFRGTGRWLTYIIPLSHTTFLKLNISGSGNTEPLRSLVQTIKKI